MWLVKLAFLDSACEYSHKDYYFEKKDEAFFFSTTLLAQIKNIRSVDIKIFYPKEIKLNSPDVELDELAHFFNSF